MGNSQGRDNVKKRAARRKKTERLALAKASKPSEIKIYPAAPHGFHADYRPSYRKEAADDAWAQMTAWFKKNGVLS